MSPKPVSTDANTGTQTAARAALAIALILGIAAERLFPDGPAGPGWPLWIGLFGAGSILVVRQARLPWLRETTIAAVIAVAAALIMAVRGAPALHMLSMLVLVTAASLPLLRARSLRFGSTSLAAHLLGMATVGAHAALGAVPLAARDAGSLALPSRFGRVPMLILRSALLALIPLVVFGALFVSADPLFEKYAHAVTAFVSEKFFERLIIALVFGWIAAGLLRGLLPRRSPLSELPQLPALPSAEVTIAVGAVCVLFAAFVLVQARWLFDSAGALQAIPGLTVADYARRGFFELVFASALALSLLLGADAVTHDAAPAARRLLRILSGVLVVLVLIVMTSALERLNLYTDRFGLTEARLYGTVFMAWLAVVFAWFVVTTLRGHHLRFAAGPVAAGIIAVLVLAALNPDALIARVNLERVRQGATLDSQYLTQLSADAVPELVRNIAAIPPDAHCVIGRRLERYTKGEAPAWLSANRAELRARALVAENAAVVARLVEACPVESEAPPKQENP